MKWIDDGIPKSGRRGIWVYYFFRGKQCRRRYVKPQDPRKPGQLRSRTELRAASIAFSKRLTEQQRKNCRRHGAKLQTRVRLAQSGPFTGQQYYVRRVRARAKAIDSLVLSSRAGKVPVSQVSKSQRVMRPAPKASRTRIVGPRRPSRPARGYARHIKGSRSTSQVQYSQRLARPTSDTPRTLTGHAPATHRSR